jgi:coenzyme PQQ precursor peptide PqqA
MQWTRPDFQEITLNMEVTAYVNTDDDVIGPPERNAARSARRADFTPVPSREVDASPGFACK